MKAPFVIYFLFLGMSKGVPKKFDFSEEVVCVGYLGRLGPFCRLGEFGAQQLCLELYWLAHVLPAGGFPIPPASRPGDQVGTRPSHPRTPLRRARGSPKLATQRPPA